MVTGPRPPDPRYIPHPRYGPNPRYGPGPRYMPDSLRDLRYGSLGGSLRPGIQDQAAWNEQLWKADHDRRRRATSDPSVLPPSTSTPPNTETKAASREADRLGFPSLWHKVEPEGRNREIAAARAEGKSETEVKAIYDKWTIFYPRQ